MTKAQKVTLIIVLLINFTMLLYPPYEAGSGYHRHDIGHQWLWVEGLAGINFGTLAAQIVIVSTIGFTVFVLASGTTDEKFDAMLGRWARGSPKGSSTRPEARAQLNIRRGLFRLWVVFTAAFIITVFAVSLGKIKDQFDAAKDPWTVVSQTPASVGASPSAAGAAEHGPWERYQKGQEASPSAPAAGSKYTIEPPQGQPLDWLAPKKGPAAGQAGTPSASKTGMVRSPWALVLERVAIAAGVPAFVLVLGWALTWAFAGFKKPPRASN